LAALSATLGSQKEISWLRLSFENVTFESAQTPYAPGDDPWQIVPASSEMAARIEAALAGHRFVPSGFEGLTGAYYAALASGSALPITTEDARRSLEIITALYHSAETGAAVALPIAREHPKYAGW
jgi:predicted dehydrogenase